MVGVMAVGRAFRLASSPPTRISLTLYARVDLSVSVARIERSVSGTLVPAFHGACSLGLAECNTSRLQRANALWCFAFAQPTPNEATKALAFHSSLMRLADDRAPCVSSRLKLRRRASGF